MGKKKRSPVHVPACRWPEIVRESHGLHLTFVLFLALAIRLFYIFQVRNDVLSTHLVIDAQFYDQWAQRILRGELWGRTVFYQDPLYAYFLAVVYKIFGHQFTAVRIVQAVIDTATVAVIYQSTRRLFDSLTALVAAAILAVMSPLVYYVALLDKTTVSVFLAAAALALLAEAIAKARASLYGLSGFVFGIAALSRGNLLIVAAAFAPWIAFSRQISEAFRSRLKWSICFGAAVLSVVGCVAFRNYLIGHDFVLITANPGLNFFIGNNPYTIGQYIEPPFIRGIPEDEYNDAKSAAERASGQQSMTPSEVSRYWTKQGIRFIVENPAAWLHLSIEKFFLAFHAFEIAETYGYDYFHEKFGALSLSFLTFGLIAPLGLLGAIRYATNGRVSILHVYFVTYLLSLVAFFVTSRYRTPLLIVLVPFASWLLIDLYYSPMTSSSAISTALVLATLFALNHWRPAWFVERVVRPTLATPHATAGSMYTEMGDYDNGMREIQAAIRNNPGAARSYLQLGELCELRGDMKSAAENYGHAISINPRNDEAWGKMGVVYFNAGDYQKAAIAFRNAIALRPDETAYHRNLRLTEQRLRIRRK